MIIGIHQPNYLPYLGFINKLKNSDIFVILDDAQFSKGDYHNRNRIKTKDGAKWLTIPVKAKPEPINSIKINSEYKFSRMNWNVYHLKMIKENYSKSDCFHEVFPELEKIYENNYEYLIDINMNIINLLKELFSIKTPIYLSSELKLDKTIRSTEKLVEICNIFNAKKYLSGKDGPKYMDMKLFENANIDLLIQDFDVQLYKQQFGEFIPYMTALDFYFNNGKII